MIDQLRIDILAGVSASLCGLLKITHRTYEVTRFFVGVTSVVPRHAAVK